MKRNMTNAVEFEQGEVCQMAGYISGLVHMGVVYETERMGSSFIVRTTGGC